MENLILEKAREYVFDYGFSIIPLRIDKKPLIEWKKYQKRYPTMEELVQWFKDDKANIGIVTGKISDLAVLDIDGREGLESLKTYRLELPLTAKVRTGRGYHYYFKYQEGVRNFSKRYDGIDLRGEGGYVVAPPSKHPTGTLYEWERPLSGGIADLPGWITENVTEKIIERGEAKKGEKDRWLEVLQTGVSQGQRNDTLARLAGYFFSQKTSYEATKAILLDWNLKNRPPLQEKEVVRTIDSIYQTDLRKQQTATLEIIDKNFEMTDFFNSQQFVKKHKGKILHCEQWGAWLIYKNGKWCKDRTNEVYALAKETVLEYFKKASETRDDAERERLVKHAMKSCTVTAIDAMLKLSKPELAVVPEQFDRDDYILNLKDQTLELRGKEVILREQRAEDYLTKQMNVKYNEKATCPKWCGFLEKIFNNNQETIRFIQKAVGYSLTGDTGEDCMFILYGTGANGKTTFLKTITDIFGDYTANTRTETLLSNLSEGNSPNNDLARLAGSRLVFGSEAQEGRRFNEVLLKMLTGRDKITARFLHQEFFEFEPTFKIFLATNHKPIVKEASPAFWRRIRLIPFKVTIPEKERLRNFENILLEEREGIFKWALAGYMAWQREGLGIPKEVEEATREYKHEMDILGDFIEEKCIIDPEAKTATKELFEAYCKWCEENNEKPMSKVTFGRRLEEKNFENTRLHGGARGWKGIGLKK